LREVIVIILFIINYLSIFVSIFKKQKQKLKFLIF
jgi:hypothetical protein